MSNPVIGPRRERQLGALIMIASLAGMIGLGVRLHRTLDSGGRREPAGRSGGANAAPFDESEADAEAAKRRECCEPPDPSTWTSTTAPVRHPIPTRFDLGDPGTGRFLFASACAGCHGAEATGREVNGALVPAIRRDQPAEELARTILDGRGGMPAFAHLLEVQDVRDLVAHLGRR
ncbi:MAG: cytochrome c [Deltaproteobacteria bacterium]|nr:cytochrome c [Deltaproteobacteria bacterium]